ncbi:MAG: glycine--tRNA ligase subunit beta [Desulfobacterales bacterium]|nr:glycine--tRNA ligase subunit beta [Desulfobacterales bacterium]
MNTLLIEIGAEEIPAGYIIPALEAFRKSMLTALDKARIEYGKASVMGTPRRLVLQIENVADMQSAQTSTITGPPEKVAFDKEGKPTIAAQKFADKAGIAIDEVKIEETPKGRYLTAVVEEQCESTVTILEGMLDKQILSIPFPKSMRWGDLSINFARPIISLLALLGEKPLNISIGNITSSNKIFGHQFMSPEAVEVPSADAYLDIVEKSDVIPDIEKRKAILKEGITACATEKNAAILEDDELVDIVTNLVENPFPVVGSFDDDFLAVPDEVLITAMREHQKYFALVDEDNNLKPLFIAVNNTRAKNMDLVAKGHEKVLRARLSDAKFFYETDLQSSLDQFSQKLKNVTFQAKLGTVYEKTCRIEKLGAYIAKYSDYADKEKLEQQVTRAAKICKADLVSQVVIEFTKLQGVIGRAYALTAGEDTDVAHAIEQHYRPVYSGGQLPENPTACILAIADKLDTICGCFSVDLIPTGGADPYALRRQGIGIIQIMMEEKLNLPLSDIIAQGLANYMADSVEFKKAAGLIHDFLKNRMVNILTDAGYSKEAVNSALWASFDDIPDVLARVKALDALRKEPDFEPLSVTFKRVENIIKKADVEIEHLSVDPQLFEDPSEIGLHDAIADVRKSVESLIQEQDYDKALSHMATLRPRVDGFFDDVMVMAEDEKIRQNRIALLSSVSGLFKNIADFSRI